MSGLVGNSQRHVLSCRGSCVMYIIILSFWGMSKQCTPRSGGSYSRPRSGGFCRSLIWIYIVCHSFYILWMHYCMLKLSCSNFRIISNNSRWPNTCMYNFCGNLSNVSASVEAQVKPAESYICQYCDREFKHSDSLVRHEMQHLIGNSYEVSQ